METDSEKEREMTEVKRGRPREHDYEELDQLGKQFGSQTRRGQQNHHYAAMAFNALTAGIEEKPEFGERLQPLLNNARPTVLAELGRCLEEPEVTAMAVQFAAEHPEMSAKKLAAHIRRIRLGETNSPKRGFRLHDVLITTINEHLARYPETTTAEILVALQMTEDAVENSKAGSPDPEDEDE